MNQRLLGFGLLIGVSGSIIGIFGSRDTRNLMFDIAIIVPGYAAAVAGYLGNKIDSAREDSREKK